MSFHVAQKFYICSKIHFNDAEMDILNKGFFAFAAYNAGPNKIKRLRKKAAERGFDPIVCKIASDILIGWHTSFHPDIVRRHSLAGHFESRRDRDRTIV